MNSSRSSAGNGTTGQSARRANRFPELSPVQKAPSLATLNGFGFKLYGKSDFDAETDSYMTTQYFVGLFVPLFPVARYRVISDDGYQYRFIGKGQLRAIDKVHMAVFCLAVLFVVRSARVV